MHIYEKEFDFVIQRAKSLERPASMVVAGADCENILKVLEPTGVLDRVRSEYEAVYAK